MRALLALLCMLAVFPAVAAREPRSVRLFEQWKQADANGDGSLSRSEAARMPSLSLSFDAIDRDANGQISPEEVRAWRSARRARRAARRPSGLGALLAQADADGDGALSRSEVGQKLPRLAPSFTKIDANRDGLLSRNEIEAWIARRRAARVK